MISSVTPPAEVYLQWNTDYWADDILCDSTSRGIYPVKYWLLRGWYLRWLHQQRYVSSETLTTGRMISSVTPPVEVYLQWNTDYWEDVRITVVRTTPFRNSHHQVHSKSKDWKVRNSHHHVHSKSKDWKVRNSHHHVHSKSKDWKVRNCHHQVHSKSKDWKVRNSHHHVHLKSKDWKFRNSHHHVHSKSKDWKVRNSHHQVHYTLQE